MNQSNDFPYPEWQIPAQGVLLETDPAKLREKIQSAEMKIFERLRQIQRCSDGYHEQNAINHALSLIRTVRHERLGTQRQGETSGGIGGILSRDEWRALYRNAVLETNFDKLVARIDEAEKAIAERVSLDGEVSAEERRELQDSRNSLRILRTEHTELHADLDWNE
jgi:hypothetical protein